VTVKDAAKVLDVSAQTIYSLCSARVLRHSRIGLGRGKISISEEAIAEYLQAREVAPHIGPPPVAPKSIKLNHLHV